MTFSAHVTGKKWSYPSGKTLYPKREPYVAMIQHVGLHLVPRICICLCFPDEFHMMEMFTLTLFVEGCIQICFVVQFMTQIVRLLCLYGGDGR